VVEWERTSIERVVVRKSVVAVDEAVSPVFDANLELPARSPYKFVDVGAEVTPALLVLIGRVTRPDLEEAAVAAVLELTYRDSCFVKDACGPS